MRLRYIPQIHMFFINDQLLTLLACLRQRTQSTRTACGLHAVVRQFAGVGGLRASVLVCRDFARD